MAFHENTQRSVVKALTFRALVVAVNSILIFAVTKRMDVTVTVLAIANVTNTFLFFFHERLWNKVHWGKSHKKHK